MAGLEVNGPCLSPDMGYLTILSNASDNGRCSWLAWHLQPLPGEDTHDIDDGVSTRRLGRGARTLCGGADRRTNTATSGCAPRPRSRARAWHVRGWHLRRILIACRRRPQCWIRARRQRRALPHPPGFDPRPVRRRVGGHPGPFISGHREADVVDGQRRLQLGRRRGASVRHRRPRTRALSL